MKRFSLVVAAAGNSQIIGKDGKIPWHIKSETKFFKDITSTCKIEGSMNAVIMGRLTWESIPSKFRPLSNRYNVVITSKTMDDPIFEGIDKSLLSLHSNFHDALTAVSNMPFIANVYVLGGHKLFCESMESDYCDKIYYSEIENEVEGDVTFPNISARKFTLASRSSVITEGEYRYRILEFTKISQGSIYISQDFAGGAPVDVIKSSNFEEIQYLNAVDDIIKNGVHRGDRTGTGTVSKFGITMRFSLRNNVFPLLTTKKVFWRGVAEELLWFVKGCTDANILAGKGIHIWDGNGSRDFLDKLGFPNREVGDLGPVYGFQWRHFGADYVDMHANYDGLGIDQLKQCIEKIKNTPEDRRIVMTAWNPKDLKLMALPPCHMFCQFYVANGELSCQMYQRSADMGLGVPFNIASYSLLTRMLAQVCGLKAGEFVQVIGDAHVYSNHVDALKIQLTRTPRPFPTLTISNPTTDIDGFSYEDFVIHDYNPDAAIAMKMAV